MTAACESEQIPTPRPHMYPKMVLPAPSYVNSTPAGCPFTVQIPTYSSIAKTDSRFAGETIHPCWFDLKWSMINATLHCSYFSIGPERSLDKLIDDAFELASKHNVKAVYRKELVIENSFGHEGLIFDITGPVASPYQFYITDTKDHFLRGSLYFDDKVEMDSIAPVLDYLKQDIAQLMASLKFD